MRSTRGGAAKGLSRHVGRISLIVLAVCAALLLQGGQAASSRLHGNARPGQKRQQKIGFGAGSDPNIHPSWDRGWGSHRGRRRKRGWTEAGTEVETDVRTKIESGAETEAGEGTGAEEGTETRREAGINAGTEAGGSAKFRAVHSSSSTARQVGTSQQGYMDGRSDAVDNESETSLDEAEKEIESDISRLENIISNVT